MWTVVNPSTTSCNATLQLDDAGAASYLAGVTTAGARASDAVPVSAYPRSCPLRVAVRRGQTVNITRQLSLLSRPGRRWCEVPVPRLRRFVQPCPKDLAATRPNSASYPPRPDRQHHAVRHRTSGRRRRAVVGPRPAVDRGGRATAALLPGARVHRRGRAKPGSPAVSVRPAARPSSVPVAWQRRHGPLQLAAARHRLRRDIGDLGRRREALLHPRNARRVTAAARSIFLHLRRSHDLVSGAGGRCCCPSPCAVTRACSSASLPRCSRDKIKRMIRRMNQMLIHNSVLLAVHAEAESKVPYVSSSMLCP